MVEVFKTNITQKIQANLLTDQIHKTFIHYKVNFDLQDCDNILRVQCINGIIEASLIIKLLNDFGFNAEVLSDDPPIVSNIIYNDTSAC